MDIYMYALLYNIVIKLVLVKFFLYFYFDITILKRLFFVFRIPQHR